MKYDRDQNSDLWKVASTAWRVGFYTMALEVRAEKGGGLKHNVFDHVNIVEETEAFFLFYYDFAISFKP